MSKRSGAARALDMACDGVVLAVDTASVSGWAIRKGHKLMYSGECHTLGTTALDEVVALAVSVTKVGYPVLVLERPWGGRMHTLIALGQTRERWLAAWEREGLSRKRVVSVVPQVWRASVLKGAHGTGRESIREREMLSAEAECPALRGQLGGDEAAAICMSRWAVRSPKVAALLGGKRR